MAYLGPSLRREKRAEHPLRRAVVAALASIALNVALLALLAAAGAFRIPAPAERTRVALAPLSASQWEANRAIARPAPKALPTPEEEKVSGRLVELPPDQPAAAEPPPDAKFLSDRNTRVEKETVSRHAGVYPRVAARPEAGSDGTPQPPAAKPKPPLDARREAKEEGKAGREGAPGDRVALARPGGDLRLPDLGESGERGRTGREADLTMSPEALARIAGGPSFDGVGEGLPEGEETWLQAREFKYATFMNRMRNAIAQRWYPRVRDAQRERDPDGSQYFSRERTVVLGLVLDTSGALKDLSVVQSSNLEFFDRLAVSSVREAQPFPNPPSGMFHGDEQVRIPFSFTMFPGNRRGMLFWQPPASE